MQVFQSWADIIIMLVLVIAYIITFIVQKNQLNALKETSKAHADLTMSQATFVETMKRLFNPNDLENFVKMKVEQAVVEKDKENNSIKSSLSSLQTQLDYSNGLTYDSLLFIYMIIDIFEEYDKDKRASFINQVFPKYENLVFETFELLDQTVTDKIKIAIRHNTF